MTDPAEASTLDKLAQIFTDLTVEVKGLRADVQAERTGRHITTLLAVVVIVAAVAVGAAFGANFIHTDSQSCATRTQSRADVRGAISAATDELAKYAQLTPAKRAEVNDRIRIRVLDEFPPPSC